MKSQLSDTLRSEQVALSKRMSPAERLEMFVQHSRLVMEIYQAGADTRQTTKYSRVRRNPTRCS